MKRAIPLLILLSLAACGDPDPDPQPTPNPLEAVEATEQWQLPCLDSPVQVLRTEGNVPSLYAENEKDLACALGFVTARDRYFSIDMIRRLSQGRAAEFLGEEALSTDIESRSLGMALVADHLMESASPQMAARWQALADGVNAYVDQVKAGAIPLPSELETLGPLLLGGGEPTELLSYWTPQDVAGLAATLVYQLGWETTDISTQRAVDALETFSGQEPHADLRAAGAREDIFARLAPPMEVESAPGWTAGARDAALAQLRSGPRLAPDAMQRALQRAERWDRILGHDRESGFGSNSWAVSGSLTASGHPVLGSDGHLPMTIPPLFWLVHLDTELLGGGNQHAIGLTIPGLPMIAVGTNGKVANGQTQLFNDINDWYREEIVVDADGRPSATRFQGADVPLVEIPETYEVAAVLGGEGGTVTVSRWETGSGRLIYSLEGDAAAEGDTGAVNINGDWLIASDTDGDGVITALSAAYTGYFERHMMERVDLLMKSDTVDDMAVAMNGMAAYSQNMVFADTSGNIMYTGYEAMPCRRYLPRDADNRPIAGASPRLLIDGTQYPSFELRYTDDHRIAAASEDDLACTVAFDDYPHSKNPAQGFVLTANNAPHAAAWDNDLWNDPVYIGGPWLAGYRAARIEHLLTEGAGSHSVETVRQIQGDHTSSQGREYLDLLLSALSTASAYAADGEVGETSAGRMAALYASQQVAIDEAVGRLQAWQDGGLHTSSGVDTFYNPSPTADERADAVATMIFNAWMGRYYNAVFDDEGLPGIFRPTGSTGKSRAMKLVTFGVGDDNPAGLASWNPETGESIFFDDVNTAGIETRDELMVRCFVEGLEYLTTPFGGDRSGGFDTDDQDQWLWGLKHFARFESLLGEFLGNDGVFAGIVEDFSITPDMLPLSDPEPEWGDPRKGLPGFPRPGDTFCIDAAGGFSSTNFSYGSGPVMRFAVELDPDGVHGVNVLPGGQSGMVDSPHFADQAALWLGNEALPLRFDIDDVVANATAREVYSP